MDGLEVQLVVTEDCNLACDYCYMKRHDTKMSFETFRSFYASDLPGLVKKSGRYHIVFFGGEPLLNWDLILKVSKFVQADGNLVSMRIVTNGTLLDQRKIDLLTDNDIKISVSYDGLWQGNRAGGLFDPKVLKMSNVDQAHCMIYPGKHSEASVLKNYLHFRSLGIFPSFTIVEDDVWNDTSAAAICESFLELTDHVIEEIKSGNLTKLFDPYKMIFARTDVPVSRMCSMGKSVALMPDGTLYPCARMGNEKIHKMDSVESMKDIKNVGLLPQQCQKCSFKEQCRSGCVVEQEKFGGPIPEVCTIKKFLIMECLRMTTQLKDDVNFLTAVEEART
jgi:radical SAM protein with 4Fe4S-binding SPASM domain